MSGYYDAFDEFMAAWESDYPSRSRKDRKVPKRSVQYVAPGHTRVGYEHRTLNIRFKETPEQYRAKQRARRRAGARKGAKNRRYTPRSRSDEIFVEMRNGQMIYVDSRGRDISQKANRYADKGSSEILKKNLKNDKYNIEDMRALLRDAHWEEVVGNKRWSYDSKATVREFKKYQKKYGRIN